MQYSELSITTKSNLGIFTSLQLLIEIGHNKKYLFKWQAKKIRVSYQCIFHLYYEPISSTIISQMKCHQTHFAALVIKLRYNSVRHLDWLLPYHLS